MNSVQREIQEATRRFCQEKMAPHMAADDRDGRFRKELFQGLGELGLTGIVHSEAVGGAGLPLQDFASVLQEIAKTSVPYAVTLSVSSMAAGMIEKHGDLEHQKNDLAALVSGQEIGAFALSEAVSGSDAASLRTSAKACRQNGVEGFVLNGTKMWVTSGGQAKVYVVMARTNKEQISAFVLRDTTPGLSYGKAEDKMGWRTSPTRELIFENCFVPRQDLLGQEGEGLKIALSGLGKGRITIGAIAVGLAQQALKQATQYALIRHQFQQPIFDFQGLQFMLADLATETQASELLVQKACQLYHQGEDCRQLASMAKMKATDTAMKVTTDAVQILGGVGYTREYPLERFMRDAKVLQIVEGTNQIQRVVIANKLKEQYGGT